MDKVTGQLTGGVKTSQIYWGAVPFVLIQVLMVALIIAFPALTGTREKKLEVDTPLHLEIPTSQSGSPAPFEFNPSQ